MKIYSRKNVVTVLLGVFFVVFLFAFNVSFGATCTLDIEGKSDAQLQEILKQCELEIAEETKNLKKTQHQSATLESGINQLKQRVRKSELEIKARNVQIRQIGESIYGKEKYIEELDGRTEKIKNSLAELLRKAKEADDFSPVEVLLSNQDLSEFFSDIDEFNIVKRELQDKLGQIRDIKGITKKEKEDLDKKKDHEQELRYAQQKEKEKTEGLKEEKENVLKVTKGIEENYKKLIAEKERVKNQIRNRIFRTVGGQELTFGEALALVRPYENKIGVDSALVLAVLSQESAMDGVIGKNLGKCTYNQPASNKSGTVMSDSQKPSFLAIMKELGLNASTIPVSCPIYKDGAYGGAMGPAQFMPTTWWNTETGYGYKKRVSKVLDVALPSPFNNLDAFTGTALYLSDAYDICAGPKGFDTKLNIWRCTAAKYYSGLASKGSRLMRHMTPKYSYGNQVAQRALQFAEDIKTLEL